jgi:hypothetical protein
MLSNSALRRARNPAENQEGASPDFSLYCLIAGKAAHPNGHPHGGKEGHVANSGKRRQRPWNPHVLTPPTRQGLWSAPLSLGGTDVLHRGELP